MAQKPSGLAVSPSIMLRNASNSLFLIFLPQIISSKFSFSQNTVKDFKNVLNIFYTKIFAYMCFFFSIKKSQQKGESSAQMVGTYNHYYTANNDQKWSKTRFHDFRERSYFIICFITDTNMNWRLFFCNSWQLAYTFVMCEANIFSCMPKEETSKKQA